MSYLQEQVGGGSIKLCYESLHVTRYYQKVICRIFFKKCPDRNYKELAKIHI